MRHTPGTRPHPGRLDDLATGVTPGRAHRTDRLGVDRGHHEVSPDQVMFSNTRYLGKHCVLAGESADAAGIGS